jgi:uncharacterized protein (AIM24 family)
VQVVKLVEGHVDYDERINSGASIVRCANCAMDGHDFVMSTSGVALPHVCRVCAARGSCIIVPSSELSPNIDNFTNTRQLTGTAMLRPAASPWKTVAHRTSAATARRTPIAARCININATSSATEPSLEPQVNVDAASLPAASPGMSSLYICENHVTDIYADAKFEVIGTPFSLLSVSLSASQTLYTRRGTLVGLSGKSENTLSTLSFLEPFRRAPVGIPFMYQKVSSTSPVTALVSTKSPISSIVSVNLDGRQDWVISQRQALLAWTGHTLKLTPQYNVKLGLANWGNTYITGRGLLALAGSGQIYQVQVKAGESYVAHPR